jgi:dsDNA-specific endonuclease/ATPase MutS2
MNPNDLWIGDQVKIKKSRKIGSYEGLNPKGKARINVNGIILLVKTTSIELLDENEEDHEDFGFTEKELHVSQNKTKPKASFKNSLDLHIEKLNPGIQNAHPQIILDHQLNMCRRFLEDAIAKRKNVVTVIHGKGTGALKQEVLYLMQEYSAVRFAVEVNNGGAQEVWLK